MKALRIKALALNFGAAEHERASTLIVHWRGKPFADARVAVESFYDACRAALVVPAPKRDACCTKTIASMPLAKACPTCGVSFVAKRRAVEMSDYLARLAKMDCDESTEVMYPNGNPPEAVESGDRVLGGWWFFDGFPDDCDVVEVTGADEPFYAHGAGEATYRVIHVGKMATRASSRGTVTR